MLVLLSHSLSSSIIAIDRGGGGWVFSSDYLLLFLSQVGPYVGNGIMFSLSLIVGGCLLRAYGSTCQWRSTDLWSVSRHDVSDVFVRMRPVAHLQY